MANIKLIRSETDYDAALARIYELMDAEPGSPDGDELDVLVDLVELYERKPVRMGYPSPVAAIEFRMDQAGLVPGDLVPFIGSRSKVSGDRACILGSRPPCRPSIVRSTTPSLCNKWRYPRLWSQRFW